MAAMMAPCSVKASGAKRRFLNLLEAVANCDRVFVRVSN
jgi:hypothetical protein